MKSNKIYTGVLAFGLALVLAQQANAQFGRTKSKADASQGATASQTIGVDTEISISYHRPGVKERDVWGTNLAAYDRPWRAGANETTKITFSGNVKVNGKSIAAGSYSLFIIPKASGAWTVIVNKDWETWGSFGYKEAQDVTRFEVTPEDAPHQEWLRYGFDDLKADSAAAFMHWEKKKISFSIETD